MHICYIIDVSSKKTLDNALKIGDGNEYISSVRRYDYVKQNILGTKYTVE